MWYVGGDSADGGFGADVSVVFCATVGTVGAHGGGLRGAGCVRLCPGCWASRGVEVSFHCGMIMANNGRVDGDDPAWSSVSCDDACDLKTVSRRHSVFCRGTWFL